MLVQYPERCKAALRFVAWGLPPMRRADALFRLLCQITEEKAMKETGSARRERLPWTNVLRSNAQRTIVVAALSVLAASTATAQQQVELSFWTNLTTAAQANVIQKQVNECTADKPNIKVQFETVPFGSMYTRLITALRRGEPPNVMNTLEGAVAFLQAKDGIVPVTDVVDGLGRNDFITSYLAAVSKDGQIWGVPDWALHQEVWYRKDLFAKAGLKVPRSWDDLLQVAKALNQPAADGTQARFGFAVPMGRSLVAPQTYFQIL